MAIQPFATQIQPPQIQPVNAMAQVGQLMAMRNAQQENALRDLQMGQLKQGIEQENALREYLRGADLSTPEARRGLARYGTPGLEAQRALQQSEAATLQTSVAQQQLITDRLKAVKDIQKSARTPEDRLAVHDAVHADPVLGPYLANMGATADRGRAQILNAAKTPESWTAFMLESDYGLDKVIDSQLRGRTAAVQEQQLELRERELNKPEAPTMTEVVDPSDPTRMLRVDAKTYRGGSLGSAGVLGVSGKEPSSAKTAEKMTAGKELFDTQMGEIRRSYDALFEMKAIPSTTFTATENAKISAETSGLGQNIGRVLGTKAQSERNIISNARVMLLNAVKQATGMSAQQLNSNVELQTYLKALTDPSRDYESNIKTLDNLENWVNARQTSGNGSVATPSERTGGRTRAPGGPKTAAPTSGTSSADGVDTNNPLLVKQK
ncbi:MAG: hypothetical protein JSU95_04550 [Betaproteobacteria bacterium]|nr:MAG: hypothetical protein JSU95_04550 [Betaproteobacteria bacterium]